MLFSSMVFLYAFLPLILILYYISKNYTWRNFVLLIFSLVFYSWGEPIYVLLLITTTLVAYLCVFGIERYRGNLFKGRAFLVISVVALLGSLFVFKYFGFVAQNIQLIINSSFQLKNIILPIGISFYTFQVLSYVIDLYHNKVTIQKNFFYLLLYVSFFPQLIAGPIVRYKTIENQIHQRTESWSLVSKGLRRFILGLSKKVIIANNMVPIIELIKSSENNAGTGALWLGAICFAIQIYFDFSGYSDMAIGLGCMFGFSFPENFNYPYISQSITDFWRRWHISLSTWFRDYVYIPLGGNRVGKVRHIFNILLVWALTGFWHGASWNFLIWGLYYATLLLIEKLFLHKLLDKLPTILKWLVTMFFVLIGWVIFDTLDIALLGQTLKTMLVYTPTDWMGIVALDMSVGFYIFFLPLGIAFSFPIAKKINVNKNNMVHSMFINLIYLGLLALCIFFIVSSTYNPFIYFRF